MKTDLYIFRQFVAALMALSHMLSAGIHESWCTVYLPHLLNGTNTVHATSEEGSWIAAFLYIGAIVGSTVSLFMTDKFGRKVTIFIASFPYFISSLMLIYASSVKTYYLARFAAGVPIGLLSVTVPLYVGEIADPKIRGTLVTFYATSHIIGHLFISVIGSFWSIVATSWIMLTLPVLQLLTYFWIPESPYYLIMKEDFDEAKRCLVYLKGQNSCKELNRLKVAVRLQIESKGKFVELFTRRPNRKALLMVLLLFSAQQLTGAGAIEQYLKIIAKESFNFISPNTAISAVFLIRLLAVSVTTYFIDSLGRRPIIFISLFGCIFMLLSLGLNLHVRAHSLLPSNQFGFVPFLCLELFAVFYTFLSPIPSLIMSEVFPINVKVFASCLFKVYASFASICTVKLFQAASDHFDMAFSFFIYSFSCVIHLFLIHIFLFETKEKTLEEIQEHLLDS